MTKPIDRITVQPCAELYNYRVYVDNIYQFVVGAENASRAKRLALEELQEREADQRARRDDGYPDDY